MRRVPKKNISKRVADVRPPAVEAIDAESGTMAPPAKEAVLEAVVESGEEAERTGARAPRASHLPRALRTALKAAAAAAVLGGALFLVGFSLTRAQIERSLRTELQRVPLTSFGAAGNALSSSDSRPSFPFSFRGLGNAYRDFQTLSSHLSALFQIVNASQAEWPEFAFGRRGEELVRRLREARTHLDALSTLGGKLSAGESGLDRFLPLGPRDYLEIGLSLNRTKTFLDAAIAWLSSSDERHLLVFLGNPSELRPGGGFLGSYAELAVQNGNVLRVEVRDVNEPDRELAKNIVPPLPLQLVAKRWRAADANWFFDFPASAGKTIELLEASKLYGAKGITFDGALAISPRVIGDILEATGPVTLAERKLVLNKDNFLVELQKRVQQGEREGEGYPKEVLREFAPLLIQKMGTLSDEDTRQLWERVGGWFLEKDAMLYFKEPGFEDFFDAHGLTGRVFELPQGFSGDYVAVVHANVGGGKTDLVMKETVTLQSQIGADGVVQNHLVVARAHQGLSSVFPWYRVTNQDYLRVFTVPGTKLLNATGGAVKKIPRRDYRGYADDPQVKAIESTLRADIHYPEVSVSRESGKNVFATWVSTPAGKTSKTVFDYSSKLLNAPAAGVSYQFVFEKQAAAKGSYVFEINAPIGFRFRENGLPLYEYKTDDPPGRLILNLTLEKAGL